MMRFESLREGFVVSMGGRPVLSHSLASPCLFAGKDAPLFWSEGPRGSEERRGRWLRRRFLQFSPLRQFRILETDKDRLALNFEGRIGMEIVAEDELLRILLCASEFPPALRLSLVGEAGEAIYGGGGGSAFPLDLKGKRVETWGGGAERRQASANLLAAAPAGRTWPVPAFISSRDYWIKVAGEGWSAADFRSRGRIALEFSRAPRSITVAGFTTASGALGKLGRESGPAPLPPAWTSAGAIVALRGDPATFDARMTRLLEEGIAVAGLRIVDRNLLEVEMGELDLYRQLGRRGPKVLASASPNLKAGTAAWEEARTAGFFPQVGEGADAGTGHFDLESATALSWAVERLRTALAHGRIAGLRLDFEQALPGSHRSKAGKTAEELRCLWPLLWSRVVHEALPEGDFLLSSSWGWGASEGLHDGAFPSLAESVEVLSKAIAAVLAHGLSGAGFAWMDASRSFEPGRAPSKTVGTTPPKLERATAMAHRHAIELAAFGPILELDADDPLLALPAGRALAARMARIFGELAPYHAAVAEDYRQSFLPPLRHPAIHYETETALRRRGNQFMYGSDLVVAAPVLIGGEELVDLELPNDDWIHLWSSRRFRGGPVTVEAPPGCPAVFWRESSPWSSLFDSIRRNSRRR
jgi:alpha-glucosidase